MLPAAAPPPARAASRGQSAQGGVHVGTGAQGSGGGALISAVLSAPQAADRPLASSSPVHANQSGQAGQHTLRQLQSLRAGPFLSLPRR